MTEGTSGAKAVTESEWLASTDPQKMLEFLQGKASDRKLRLFAVECVRQTLPLAKLLSDQTRTALAEVEDYADTGRTKVAMKRVRERMGKARDSTPSNPRTTADDFVCYAIEVVSQPNSYLRAIPYSANLLVGGFWGGPLVVPPQTDLARCIFGNPFRPVTINPACLAWNDGTVVKLAQGIYDGRDFDRLPILADPLEKAGCTNADVLAHCRSEGPHVRGCWLRFVDCQYRPP
jgi:hypothetical protein